MTLTVACVNHGDYLGRGHEYVRRMKSMVARNLAQPYEFVVLQDEGSYGGWWSKIELFRPGRFKGRVLYLDLDSVAVGPLDLLAAQRGIIDLRDWGWLTEVFGSGVMVWDGDEHREIFDRFDAGVARAYRGDQDWITELGGWEVLPAHLCRSYRYHCAAAPPEDCVHVSMHGNPKPHEILSGWVPGVWQ